jgi:hypothetical protein
VGVLNPGPRYPPRTQIFRPRGRHSLVNRKGQSRTHTPAAFSGS